ncbi:hypothetical protein DdX_16858 [Ditylenchus destructor]|uniref:Uncharacterized protein n=1 Tax=Ditylenchus destructor TaxID=166010 RepID=A0AAD4MPL3_9BILA|nr:hypothetical protein DdX_16858 [Ditylenchus destructor]
MAISSIEDEQSNENIRVSVRICPESSGTSEKSALCSNELTNSIILCTNIKQEKRYRFDNIFSDKSSQIYGSIMMECCPETCIGTETVSEEECEDQNDDCVTWDQNFSFCDSEFYSEDSKADVSEYTCGFC